MLNKLNLLASLNLLEKICLHEAVAERSAATANRRPGETPCKKSKHHSA